MKNIKIIYIKMKIKTLLTMQTINNICSQKIKQKTISSWLLHSFVNDAKKITILIEELDRQYS